MTFQILSNTPPGYECRLMMALWFARVEKEKKKNNCKSVFHICKWWVLMSLRLFCQQWRAHMEPEFHTLARHMERQPLSVAVVCLFWRGVMLSLSCVRTCVSDYMHVVVFVLGVFFLSCDSILLDFWAQSVVHMVLAALWIANVSVTVKPMGQDWEVWKAEKDWMSMWQKERGWGQRQRRCNDSLLPFVLPCAWNPGLVHLKCLHGWLIKGEKLPLLINWQAEPHMSQNTQHTHTNAWTGCTMQTGPSAIRVVCLYPDSTRFWGKGWLHESASQLFKASLSALSHIFCVSVFMCCWVCSCVCRVCALNSNFVLHFHKTSKVVRKGFKKSKLVQQRPRCPDF